MLKRKSSSDDERRGQANRPKPQAKKHLYLLLDDWERGYSIRKLDIDAFADHDAKTDNLPPIHFTEPPVARIKALHETSCNLISHGTKIFAMQPGESNPAIPAFDTHTHALTICPWPSCQGDYYSNPLFASVSGKLFFFTDVLAEVLGDQPPPYDSKAPWSWTTINKARPPFHTRKVLCCALHPDGRKLFVSAGERLQRNREEYSSEQGQGTFSFDAERLQWTRHGSWVLPFSGEAYFDAELDAWVGLCGERNCTGWLCSCDVVASVADGDQFTGKAPSWKLGQEKLCGMGPQVHLGAKLVYMGDSNFCLVESQLHKADEQLFHDSQLPWPPRRRVLCITTFGLKYNKKGELQTKLRRAGVCKTYKQPHDIGGSLADFAPSAFWL